MSWVNRLTGKYRAIFDVPEIDSGYGVWRASIWGKQYQEVLGAKPNELSAVLVLRHTGIQLAMQQAYWDSYAIGKEKKVLHPVTQQGTDRNPALLASSRNEVPAMFDDVALDRFIARGGIVLACNLALQDVVEAIQKKENATESEARKQAIAFLVPGVILQPSGVFAALHAQDAGCKYIGAPRLAGRERRSFTKINRPGCWAWSHGSSRSRSVESVIIRGIRDDAFA